jgi:acyl transferase domain-containing protein/NAD(P)-dependent dehydrogenase (short-subunit alcohol dehydrogenase family)/acyl carrier protein
MEDTSSRAIAIVGVGAVLPDATNVAAFWENIKGGRYSISEVTPDRWDSAFYYDADPKAPDKTYSKIGGWVREYEWEPMKWRMPIPPRVAAGMDDSQKWAIACTHEALEDYGYPGRPLNTDRTAVILGSALGGEKHYRTVFRVVVPEFVHELEESVAFAALPEDVRRAITKEFHGRMGQLLPEITEDTMPGELANCIAGRIANIYNFHGPNFVTDAACASSMAAINASMRGLAEHEFDVAVTGGIDRNMGASTFVKFCKIGALSATGTRPYAEGADGFVMGEGAVVFLMKRLADAERDGDKIYALLRGMAGASDGKGKGITAPNPAGQKMCIERAWENAGLSPATVTLIEGHGTSTRVGDVVEAQSMAEVLSGFHLATGSVVLGSVKSNLGHLKGAAGAAAMLKVTLALRDKVLPPSVRCTRPNPDIDFAHSPLYVNTELKPWEVPEGVTRRAGLSAFGFGGTNFHAVLEEYIPHMLNGNGKRSVAVGTVAQSNASVNDAKIANAANVGLNAAGMKGSDMNSDDVSASVTTDVSVTSSVQPLYKTPLRGALVLGAATEDLMIARLLEVLKVAEAGSAAAPMVPAEADLRASERLVIDYGDAAELADKASKALKALKAKQPAIWKALRPQGIFRGHGLAPKVAFLYTGQGSQYVNMLRALRTEKIVADTFGEADRVMTPLLGKSISDYIFVDKTDEIAVAQAEEDLRQTAITQPAVLAVDMAFTRMLAAYGIHPDMAMGHSLGEYGALVASGALRFDEGLEAVSARGMEMTRVSMKDNGRMAAVFGPIGEVERILKTINGYVVVANINSDRQSVIGGASDAVEEAMRVFEQAGFQVVGLPVSHAFHTSIVSPASEPVRKTLQRLHLEAPRIPVVANLNGEFYPTGPNAVPLMIDILGQQVAAPVQFVKGLRTLYDAGARIFIETGPKKALHGFAEDVLGERGDVLSLFTNHPKFDDFVAFNQALCGLYASGLGIGLGAASEAVVSAAVVSATSVCQAKVVKTVPEAAAQSSTPKGISTPENGDRYNELGHMFAEVLERGWKVYGGRDASCANDPVVITGAALGLPGSGRMFDDDNVARILRGDMFINSIPMSLRQKMLDKRITRLVKNDNGGARFESIDSLEDVIKLAGRGGDFDPESEFGISAERIAALDRVTSLAIAVGIDALRDAGIPLVMRYKTTSLGTLLPEHWGLPDALRDDTGVIFGSAFPGYDAFAEEMSRFYADRARREQLAMLEEMRTGSVEGNGHHSALGQDVDRRIVELRAAIESDSYSFERRFLFKALSMGHSQFAEFIGARGPNTQINSACATTTQAVTLAEDWIRAGRCRRVIVITADDVTSENLIGWMGAGFLASGAAATDALVEEAATPFDRRRHGLIMGMGAAALIVESAEAAGERGIRPICEVLNSVTANSAFHGSRLDVQHIGQVMEKLVAQAESSRGISRREIAPKMVFVSHETYTPARGGSSSAEIFALRQVFGDVADQIVIANTKGLTGHAMATGIEDVVAVKSLETGCVPPVANFKEVDPELGVLNLSKGGAYPVEYALRLGAGFGSQISMTLLHWVPTKDGVRPGPSALGYATRIADPKCWKAWLSEIAGVPEVDLEVVQHTLRVRDLRAAARVAELAQDAHQPTPVTVLETPSVTPIMVAEEQPRTVRVEVAKTVTPVMSVSTSVLEVVTPEPATGEASVPIVESSCAATSGSVRDRILALAVEKTGYPEDMLDLELDLEADLGVDTVKQAEMLAAIREIYGIPRDENLKLRDFPTLAKVIQFVYDRRPDLVADASKGAIAVVEERLTEASAPAASMPAVPAPVVPITDKAGDVSVKERILALAVEKTGYPEDMLDLELDLEADLGVDTVKQAEMLAAIREIYGIPRDENLKLRDFPTLAKVIQFVYDRRPDLVANSSKTAVAAVEEKRTEVPAAAAPPSAELSNVTSDVSVKERILALAVEKTGYPEDMLDLELDLEADLGVDTVKQAEMLAAIREIYGIPRDENLKLRDFPTLAKVIQYACDRRSGGKASTQPTTQTIAAPPNVILDVAPDVASSVAPDVKPLAAKPVRRALGAVASFEAAELIPRRVPVPNLRPPLSLCKSTGVRLGVQSRVVIMPDKGGVAEALSQRLRTMGVEVLRIDIDNVSNAEALTKLLNSWMEAGPLQGIYWLPALDREAAIGDMDLAGWHEALWLRLKSLYVTMRTLYEQIAAPGTFLTSATRLGGQHGYDTAGAVAPMGGAVTGFTKTYKRERMDALVKAVDFEAERKADEIAELLIEETLRDPGAVEIGYKQRERWTIALEEQAVADGQPGLTLSEDSVFVVTGAAGSIVSAITADLAMASGGTFYLLDLVPEPDAGNPDLERFVHDKEGLKRDLFARIQARGERATPALVEKELAGLERAQAAQRAINAVREAGGTAHYFSVNLTDADAVAAIIQQVRASKGRIDVLLHAAGLERSHSLPDKNQNEFDLVFDVKCDGWFNLLHAIGDMPIGATVGFSSIAGRFGNAGQTDYSSANDLLCKFTSSFRRTRPATRGIAIDWTAWGGIGMATRGSIPKMMELAGIDMLPPEAGVPWIRRELTTGGRRGEVVVGQRLGVLLNEWDESGGLDTVAASSTKKLYGPMIGRIVRMSVQHGLAIETTLDPKQQAFLYDHQIDGTPVLPGVMGIEAFAEAAQCMLPGWRVEAVEDVNFIAPFKFYRGEARTVSVEAVLNSRGDAVVATCRLTGSRQLPNHAEPLVTTHFTARVRLTKQSPRAGSSPAVCAPEGSILEGADIYQIYFHGPAYRVLDSAWRVGQRIVGRMADHLPENHSPAEEPTLMAPRLIELCFQTAGLWEMSEQDRMGLPLHVHRASLWMPPSSAEVSLYAVVTPGMDGESFDAEVVDSEGNRLVELTGYRSIALPTKVNSESLKALQPVRGKESDEGVKLDQRAHAAEA